jgi:hypothetical protein
MKQLFILFVFFGLSLILIEAHAQTSDQFYLRVKSEPSALFYVSGAGSYKEGETVILSTMPDTWEDNTSVYKFVGWKIDGSWSTDNPPKVVMNASHEAVAVFEKVQGVGGDAIIIDAIPRIAGITVDSDIYLPEELPLSIKWDTTTDHIITAEKTVNENPDKRYVFGSWKDGNADPVRTVKPDDTTSFIALYKTQFYLKVLTEFGNSVGQGWYDEGSTVNFSLDSEHIPDKNDDTIQYSFDSWDLGDYKNSVSNSISINAPLTVKANWDKEYKLEIRTNIPDYIPSGSGFYPSGKNLALIAESEINSANSDTKYIFDKWVTVGPNPVVISNSLSPSTSVLVDSSYIIEARYKKSFLLNVWSPYGAPVGGGFYDEGKVADVRINQNELVVVPGKEKKIFGGWNTAGGEVLDFNPSKTKSLDAPQINSNLQVIVSSPMNVTAKWNSQYYVDVKSSSGTVTGAGWYDPGTLVPISVKMPSQPPGMWTTYSFVGWSGDIDSTATSTKIIVSGPKSVIAEWREDSTPGIINGLILAGVGVTGFFIFNKTRKSGRFSSPLKSKYGDYPGDRRGIDSMLQHDKSNTSIPQKNTYQQDIRLPKKKSVYDWLMGNDK